jgi:hypothetical protein
VWLGTFTAVAALLLIRSAFLFSTRLYETADEAANSILVMQAQHFTLLHGNYSRTGFFHPGPAYLYVMAAGQWLFHDLTHLVPTPWNGQLLAILLLNSALVATVATIVYGWARSVWAAITVPALIICLAAAVDVGMPALVNRDVLAANWMPDMYVPVFLAFLVAAASVAAGRTQHLWLLAGTGWLLIHGHAEFLFFVPLIVAATALAALWPTRRAPLAAVRRFARGRWRHYAPALLVSALFATPIVVGLVLHWPGQFGKYWHYARSPAAGHHSPGQVAGYLLWYWSGGSPWRGVLVLAAAVTAAVLVAVKLAPASPGGTGLRRFLLAALWIGGISTAGMLYYGVRGIDTLSARYVGFFYWSVPLLTLLVTAVGVTAALPGRRLAMSAGVGVAVAALAVGAVSPALRADVHDNEPALVPAMAALAARAGGRTIVLDTVGAEYDTHGLLLQAARQGVRACATGSDRLLFAVTSQFICGPRQLAAGYLVRLYPRGYQLAQGQHVIAALRYSVVTIAASAQRPHP